MQRKFGSEWRDWGGQAGEVPVTIAFPQGSDAPSFETGSFEWRWTAHFEAFASRFDTVEGLRRTPAGTYRFVVDGLHRSGGQGVPYHLISNEFQVKPWDGITVEDMQVDADGKVSFKLGPRKTRTLDGIKAEIGPIDYPDTYDYGPAGAVADFIDDTIRGLRDPAAPNDPHAVRVVLRGVQLPAVDRLRRRERGHGHDRARGRDLGEGAGHGAGRALEDRPRARRGRGRARRARLRARPVRQLQRRGFGARGGGRAARRTRPASWPRSPIHPGSRTRRPAAVAALRVAALARPRPARGPLGPRHVPPPAGVCSSRRVGKARLGLRRARHRELLPGLEKPRGSVDRFCHADGGKTRIGYPTRRFLALLSQAERRRVKGRAVLILSSSRHFSRGGITNGSTLGELLAAFGNLRSYRVGANVWHLGRVGRSRLLFKVRDAVVGEVGVADLRLTRAAPQAALPEELQIGRGAPVVAGLVAVLLVAPAAADAARAPAARFKVLTQRTAPVVLDKGLTLRVRFRKAGRVRVLTRVPRRGRLVTFTKRRVVRFRKAGRKRVRLRLTKVGRSVLEARRRGCRVLRVNVRARARRRGSRRWRRTIRVIRLQPGTRCGPGPSPPGPFRAGAAVG